MENFSFKDSLLKLITPNVIKDSEEPKSIINEMESVMAFINVLAYVVGVEFTSTWEFNFRAKFIILLSISYTWVEGFTYYSLFPSITCVELTSGCMFTALVITKFSFFVFHHEVFVSLVNFMYEVVNKNTEGKRQQILIDTTATMLFHFKVVCVGFSSAAVVYLLYPGYDYIVNRNLTPVAPLIFPFADGSTRSFLVETAINLTVPAVSILGLCGVTCMFLAFVEMYAALVTLIEDDFDRLDDMYKKKHENANLRKAVFRNITLEMMDFARFNQQLNTSFGLITTMQISCSFVGIATALFGFMANNYVGGIGGFFYYVTELMIFCFIGQIMDDQTENIETVIYNSDWYVYEIHNQKILLFALSILQRLKSTTVGGIMPLNLETGVTVAKNIYSILMFLLNMLE